MRDHLSSLGFTALTTLGLSDSFKPKFMKHHMFRNTQPHLVPYAGRLSDLVEEPTKGLSSVPILKGLTAQAHPLTPPVVKVV